MNGIGLIGFGRFGRLLYNHLKNRFTITVYDPSVNPENEFNPAIFQPLQQVYIHKYLILAVPVSSFSQLVSDISPHIQAGTVVMDVCAVKQYPLKVMEKHLSSEVEIVGTHPLFGPDSVRESLEGHTIILTPQRISALNLKVVKDFWQDLGITIIEMSPEEHDRLMAWTLALTHFLGRSLKTLPLPDTSVSTRDYQNLILLMEKINRDTWKLFEDMHHYNPFTADMRRQLLGAMTDLNERLDQLEDVAVKNSD